MAGRVLDTLITRLQFTGDTKALERANKRVDALKKNLKGISTGMMAIGGAAAGASFFVGRTVLDAERASNNLQAVGQLTQEEMSRLQAQARNLGATTSYSFREVTRAQTELKLSGQSVNAVMATTPHVMHLAAAGQMEMGRAAQMTTNLLNAYELEASEAQRVTDVLAAIATSSSTTVAELGVSFRQVASDANRMNMDIEQTGAAFAVLRNLGNTAEKSGIVLRNFLTKIRNPTAEGEESLRNMLAGAGIAYEEFQGLIMTGQVMPALEALNKGMATVGTEQQQAAVLDRIFDQESSGAIASLVSNLDLMQRMENQYRDVTGTVRQMYDTQTQGLVGTVGALRSAWEELQLSVGEAGFTDELVKWMTMLKGAVDTLNQWINARQRLEELKTAPFGTADWREYGEMSWFEKQQAEAKALVGGLIVPATVGALALGALGFAVFGLTKVLTPLWTLFKVGTKVVRGIGPAFRGVQTVVRSIGPAFRTVRFGLWAMYYYGNRFVHGPGRTLVRWGQTAANVFRNVAGPVFRGIASGIRQVGPAIARAVAQWGPHILRGIVTVVPRILPIAIGAIKTGLVTGISGAAVSAGAAAVAIPAAIAGAITAGVVGIVGSLVGFDVLWADLKASWNSFANLWREPAKWWADAKAEWQAFTKLFTAPGEFFGLLWQDLKYFGDLIAHGPIARGVGWLTDRFADAWRAIVVGWSWLGAQVSSIGGHITGAVSWVTVAFGWVKDAAMTAVSAIVGGWSWLGARVSQGIGYIQNAFYGLSAPLEWLTSQFMAIRQKIGAALAWVLERFIDVANVAPDWLQNDIGISVSQLEKVVSGLRNPLDEALPASGPRLPIAPANSATILAGAGSGAGGGVTRNNQLSVGAINLTISVDGSGDPRETAAAVEEAFRAHTRQMFETLVVDVDSGIAE